MFSNSWDELSYLCQKVDYYVHVSPLRSRASSFVLRLRKLLRSQCRAKGSIVAETARSLVNEYDGRWKQSAVHRERELELILQLQNSFTDDQGPEVRDFALQMYTTEEVSVRLSRISKTYAAKAGEDEAAKIDQFLKRV